MYADSRYIQFACPTCLAGGKLAPSRTAFARQSSLHEFTSSPEGTQLVKELKELKELVQTNHNEVLSVVQTRSPKSAQSPTLINEIKRLTEKCGDVLSSAPKSFSEAASRKPFTFSASRAQFPELTNRTPKRKRMDDTLPNTPKLNLKNRKLTSGTANSSSHGLGAAVTIVTRQRPQRPVNRLVKSVYVSRLEKTITTDDVTAFVKKKIPEADDADFNLRLLVKKDGDLSKLSFVSFRLQCTMELYTKFMDPSFWPSHVMIGDFIDKPKPRSTFGSFIPASGNESVNNSPVPSSAVNPKMPQDASSSKLQSQTQSTSSTVNNEGQDSSISVLQSQVPPSNLTSMDF